MVHQRNKGKRGELEVVALLKEYGYLNATRTSDGRSQGERGDIAGGPPGFHLEVKYTQRLRLREAMLQAQADAVPGDVPLVVHRGDTRGEPWLATYNFEYWLGERRQDADKR